MLVAAAGDEELNRLPAPRQRFEHVGQPARLVDQVARPHFHLAYFQSHRASCQVPGKLRLPIEKASGPACNQISRFGDCGPTTAIRLGPVGLPRFRGYSDARRLASFDCFEASNDAWIPARFGCLAREIDSKIRHFYTP